MKKLFMLALALGLLLALSVCALAADATEVTVGGKVLPGINGEMYATTDSNTGEVTLVSGEPTVWNIKFDKDTATLTLKNAEIAGASTAESDINAAVYANGDLTIELVGTNTATGGDIAQGVNSASYGINVTGNLTISGDGSLTATGGEVSSDFPSHGICVDDGELEILGTTVIAKGDSGVLSYGIYAKSGIKIENSNVTAQGGEAPNESYGMSAPWGNVVIRGSSTVNATGGEANSQEVGTSFGIRADGGNVDIGGSSTVNATGGKAFRRSYGIYAGEGADMNFKDIIVSGSARVTAQSDAAGERVALYAKGSVKFDPANRLVMAGADENSAVEWTGTNANELNRNYRYVRISPPEPEQEQEQEQRIVREEKVVDNSLVPAERIIEEPPVEENPNTGLWSFFLRLWA